jgi:hypothetical protein
VRRPDAHLQAPAEQLLAELGGAVDEAQGRVQDRHPVAEPLGFFEAVGGEEDRHVPLPQRSDEVMDLARRHRVEPGGGLVEEEDRRVGQQRPGERHPLAQTLGQRTAQVICAVGQLDRPRRPMRSRASASW